MTQEEIKREIWQQEQKDKCQKKRRYPSKGFAEQAYWRELGKRKLPKMYAYHCPWCRSWHLARN